MLKSAVIVVIGGSGLIGRSFCRAISENDGIAIAADINVDENIGLARCEYNGLAKCKQIYVDITNEISVMKLIDLIDSEHGRIDAVINCAYPRSKNYGAILENVTYKDFCQGLNMHLGGFFLVSQKFALYFKKQGYGNIINLASIYGSVVPRFEIYKNTSMTMPIEYSAIKSGIIQMTKYFSQYFKGHQIRVNSLSPGGVLQDQPKEFLLSYKKFCNTKGMLSAEDLIGTMLFLLSDAAKYITGQNIIVDDGFSL